MTSVRMSRATFCVLHLVKMEPTWLLYKDFKFEAVESSFCCINIDKNNHKKPANGIIRRSFRANLYLCLEVSFRFPDTRGGKVISVKYEPRQSWYYET